MFGIQYKVGVDGLSLVLVVLTTTLTWISILASFGPIQNRVKEYMISFLVLEVGMIGVFVAMDLFLFYIFWELVLVPMYLIIGIWGGTNRIYATIKFVLYTLVGSLLMLVAILATAFTYQAAHAAAGTGAFDVAGAHRVRRARATSAAPSGSSPSARSSSRSRSRCRCSRSTPGCPTPTSRRPPRARSSWPASCSSWAATGSSGSRCRCSPRRRRPGRPLIIVLSLIAIIYGAIVALVQPDLKKLVAYSSVSHMGFVTLGIFVFQQQGLQGAILQMVNHGLITGALFLLVGVIYERTHDRTIAKMGGLGAQTPVYAAAFGFFVFASVGLPGLSGFVGEFLTLVGHVRDQPGRGGGRDVRDDPRRRLPAVDVPAGGVRRAVGLPQGPGRPPHRHAPGRGADARAAGRPGRGLRPVPGPDPRPHRRLRRQRARRRRSRPHPIALGLWR